MSSDSLPDPEAAPVPGVPDFRTVVRTSAVTGAAIVVPLLVTVAVVWFVASLVSDAISPFVLALSWVPGTSQDALILQLLTVAVLVLAIVVIGYVSAYRFAGSRVNDRFDSFMESIPGLGPVYKSFNQMSELLIDADTESFQEVKLVEYPTEDSYVVAFKTSEPPRVLHDATDSEEMVTLFMPMAPNPVMGGFVLYVSADRVFDVDLTVEEGIRSVVTSGVALGQLDNPRTDPATTD